MTNKINFSLILLAVVLLTTACSKLDQLPKDTATPQAVFSNESGLALYTNSFYLMLPEAGDIQRGDAMADYTARREVSEFIRPGAYSARQGTGWDWEDLRNINYFIENCTDESVPSAVRSNYLGIARFFRAWFYFDKVKRFGDVPWINKTFDVSDVELFNGRDSRTIVMDSILADLDYACLHIAQSDDASRTLITKNIAYALKSRVCLFEGTFRKYHTDYGLQNDAATWLQYAADAAKVIMENGSFSIHEGAGTENSYRQLFTSKAPVSTEVMLAVVYDDALSVYNDANWYWTSATYGDRASLTRTFINTYLTLDGEPFTNHPNHGTMTFTEEVENRDLRLRQTIRYPGYTRINGGNVEEQPPLFSYTFTGYQPIKWTLDDMFYDAGARNDNAMAIFRYAEILLNYAEAKAELGTISDNDWAETIGVLRRRAGISAGLSALPQKIDTYLQTHYFPEINNAPLLEIRRERGIELVFEGFRFYDLVRWKKGELLDQTWNGIYINALHEAIDLNDDQTPDVYFYTTRPENQIPGVIYINVSPTINGAINPHTLANGDHGELIWLNNVQRQWDDKFYLYPIPENDRLRNPELGQNPGW